MTEGFWELMTAKEKEAFRASIGPVRPFPELGTSKEQVLKVCEETSELLYAVCHGTEGDVAEELGDVIQAAVNLAAVCGVDTTAACLAANERNRERGRF